MGRRREDYLGTADDEELIARNVIFVGGLKQPTRHLPESGSWRAQDLPPLTGKHIRRLPACTITACLGQVPSPDDTYPTIKVPELNAYPQGLPYLKYVLSNSQEAPILSPHGVLMVRVPVPERYAIHKLMVSQLRGTASSKAAKDLRQAATLLEAVVARFPGAVEDALSAVPKSAGQCLRRAIPALKRHLPASAEAVWAVLPSRT